MVYRNSIFATKFLQMAKFCASFFLVLVVFAASAQEKKLAQPDLKGDIMLDLGWSYWKGDRDTTEAWPSKSIGIYYTQRVKISDKFSFYPAVGVGVQKLGLKKNYHMSNHDGVITVDTTVAIIKRNQFNITYLDAPMEIRFHPKGTEEGEGFFVGAGVIGGLKLGAYTKLKYTQDGHKRTEKLRSNFGLNDVRYGFQIRVGWKGANFFFKRYLSETYRKPQQVLDADLAPVSGQFINPTTSVFGINFTGF